MYSSVYKSHNLLAYLPIEINIEVVYCQGNCSSRSVHLALFISPCSSRPVHPALFIPHCSSRTVHPALFIQHCSSRTVHPALFIPHCSSRSVHPALFIPLDPLYLKNTKSQTVKTDVLCNSRVQSAMSLTITLFLSTLVSMDTCETELVVQVVASQRLLHIKIITSCSVVRWDCTRMKQVNDQGNNNKS